MTNSHRSPIIVGLIVEDRFNFTKLYANLSSLGYNIVQTYTNNPMNDTRYPISHVKYVDDKSGFIGNILAIEQIKGYTYWIENEGIERQLISIIPMDEFAYKQVMRNINGVVPNVHKLTIALSNKLSHLYSDVDYIISPTMPKNELRDKLIDVLGEIKYNFM